MRTLIITFIFFLCHGYVLGAIEEINARRSTTLFQGAQRCFRAEQWETAANWLQEFIRDNPDSPQRNMAILLRAQALFRLKQYRDCFNELKNAEKSSGLLAAEYRFWMAECRYREAESASKNESLYRVAAQLFADVPKSDRHVAANVSEAMAYAHLEDWPKVVELLQPAEAPFQQHVSVSGKSVLVTQGNLILAEALLRQNLYENATRILDMLSAIDLTDQDHWRHQMQLSRALIAQKKYAKSLRLLTELLHTAENRMPQLRAAQAVELMIHIHEKMGNFSEAIEICQILLQEGMPRAVRRRGLLLAVHLTARHGATFNITQFQQLSQEVLEGDSLAAFRVALGDVYLVKHQQAAATEDPLSQTNNLAKSREQYISAIGSTFTGHARIGLGWGAWQERRYADSCTNFIQAATELTSLAERDRSQFKAIESAFRSGSIKSTLRIGRNFMTNFPGSKFRGSVRYLMFYAAIREAIQKPLFLVNAHHLFSELDANKQNRRDYENAVLLLARAESQGGSVGAARQLLKTLPADTTLKRAAELEMAGTYIREQDWDNAISQYKVWLMTHVKAPSNERAKILFDLGWLHFLNKSPAKTTTIYSDIIKQFPATSEAARAQMWMADQLFNRAEFVKAEESYQKVRDMHNCPITLKYRASLMAGRAALARRSFNNARDYFSLMIKDATCPEAIKIEAIFALSNTAVLNGAKFDEAITILETILKPNRKISPYVTLQVYGRIGDCHLQMTLEDPNRHVKAREAYSRVLEISSQLSGDPSVRYRAMMGMAHSLTNEEDATKRNENLIQALGWAKKVFEGASTSETELETFWVRQSGLMSAELQGLLNKPIGEIATLEALGKHFNMMRPTLNARISRIRQQLRESSLGIAEEK